MMNKTVIKLGSAYSSASGRLSPDDSLDMYSRTQDAVKTSNSNKFKEDFNSLAFALILGALGLILFYNKK